QKCIFGIRYDIDTANIDFQCLLEEYEDLFRVFTDNLEGLYNYQKSEFINESTKMAYDAMLIRLNEVLELFEVVKLCLFLPAFFNEYNDKIAARDVPTALKEKLNSPIYNRRFKDIYGKPLRQKTIYSLFLDNSSKDALEIEDEFFNIQRSGY